MPSLKKIGRKVRRIRRDIAAMHPDKLYPLRIGDKVVPMRGKDWKNSVHGKPKPEAD